VKLRQVLINLLDNALKFTREGNVTLQIVKDYEPCEEVDGCRFVICVIDTGPGIAAEELNKLGGAFVQAQAGRHAREGTGFGIGH